MSNIVLDDTQLGRLWTKLINTFQLKAGSIYYDSTTTYIEGNIVLYNGCLYVCKQSSTGNLPTNTTYWSAIDNKIIDLRQ